jgi:hypothetical protein
MNTILIQETMGSSIHANITTDAGYIRFFIKEIAIKLTKKLSQAINITIIEKKYNII